jgi:hypothetical protein
MADVPITIHQVGTVPDASTGKATEGLIVSFGDYKMLPLSWRAFKALLKMRFHTPALTTEPTSALPGVNRLTQAASNNTK